ncbi:MAG: DUF1549 domain-containing protein [Planctomycetaceae bacterium]
MHFAIHWATARRYLAATLMATSVVGLGVVGLGVSAATAAEDGAAAESGSAGSFTTGSSDVIIQRINAQLRQGWSDNEIEPSPVAGDGEWMRRVYLDIAGHIPPTDEIEKFIADKDPAKRSKLIEKLLDDPAYVRNFTAVWTNLSIGRGTPARVSRDGMEKFYREAFARNRPWNDVVYDLVSAEGHYERNGAVNFMLAQMQMNDEAVQATAKTTRLFLGIQVQCTQCHDHPFNDWKQDQFWQFNSFFRQMAKIDHRRYDERTGRMVDDYSELVDRDFSGPVYFEKRNGLMQVAYPEYEGRKVDPGLDTDRRAEFAKLIVQGDRPLLAQAMTNRMWGHFFGYGFTKPVDDIGPHNPASHPQLLEMLSEEFVNSRYDVKQLVRWIANSEAYNLTSRTGPGNEIDNPAAGEIPQFSHMYAKQMQAEQLFDSLVIATEAHKSGRTSWEDAERQRRQWMQQFVVAFDTDEADEATTFNGTIPQALMMMNGDLVKDAISLKPGGFLHRTLSEPTPDSAKVRKLYLSALSREPTRAEEGAANRLLRPLREPGEKLALYQDLFWALLNSNEFIFVH